MLLDHLVSATAADYVPEIEEDIGKLELKKQRAEKNFVGIDEATPAQTLDAQMKTADWLDELTGEDDEVIISRAQEQKAAETFAALATHDPDAKNRLLTMQVPEEIRATVAMVSAYQWRFVEQAEQLRNMAVTKIVAETDHPDAKVRLKALEMLGKVTEVALFTERVEVKKTDLSDDELAEKIRQKLSKYMGRADIVDVEMKENEAPPPEEDVGIVKTIGEDGVVER